MFICLSFAAPYSQRRTDADSCGIWKAAKGAASRFAKKDQMGCLFATCRHSLLLKALDMTRGEMFVYPYIMQVGFVALTHIIEVSLCSMFFFALLVERVPRS